MKLKMKKVSEKRNFDLVFKVWLSIGVVRRKKKGEGRYGVRMPYTSLRESQLFFLSF